MMPWLGALFPCCAHAAACVCAYDILSRVCSSQVRSELKFQAELRSSLQGNSQQWQIELAAAAAASDAAYRAQLDWVPKLEAKVNQSQR